LTELLLELTNILLPNIASSTMRLYPMWEARDMKARTVFIVYACLALYLGAGFLILKQFWGGDIRTLQIYRTFASIPTLLMPFWVFRKKFWQNVFLLSIALMYAPVIVGTGIYAGQNWFRHAAYPLLATNIVSLAVTAFTLPPLLFMLRRLLGNPEMEQSVVWRLIWLLPALYFCIYFFTGNPFNAEYFKSHAVPIIRLTIYATLLLTCYLLERAMRQMSENVTLKEHARAAENQLAMQREQYERMMKNAETVKFMRHDMRHHLNLMGELARGETKLEEYIQNLSENLHDAQDKLYCANYAVNAVTAHYLGIAESEGVSVEASLEIPEDTGNVPAIDLCVIMGNLLENAVEACRRMTSENRFIRVRALITGDSLSIVVANSFDGMWLESGKEGVYLSRKTDEGETAREGVGLSSVKAISAKHFGIVECQITGGVWISSALAHME